MPPSLLVGLAAGLASAALFASASYGAAGARMALYLLAPLPAFLAGLGWGSAAAAVAALATALGCALLLSLKAALVILLTQGLPVAILCHLAQLNRTVAVSGEGDMRMPAATAVEWYPIGRIVAAAVLMAGAIAFLTVFLLGASLDDLRKIMRALVEEFMRTVPGLADRKLDEKELAALTDAAVHAMPAVAGLLGLGGLLLNLYIAGRVTHASGRLPRPWPDLAAMTFPRGFAIGLAGALAAAALLPGYSALLPSGYAGAFLFAYLLLGLAVIHGATRGLPARPFILWAVYIGLFALNTWAALAIAALGALEPLRPLRLQSRIVVALVGAAALFLGPAFAGLTMIAFAAIEPWLPYRRLPLEPPAPPAQPS